MVKKKKKPPYNPNSAIRSALRRTYSRSPDVIATMKKVRRERDWFKKDGTKASKPRVEYQCANCKGWFMGKDIQVDHIEPVVCPHTGFVDWNTFIDRLFCGPENLAVLCKHVCHKAKTDMEKALASERRKNLKLQQKK